MNDETKQRLELLKTARQQLSNQYIKDRADAYTQWVVDSDRAWRETGMKLPFPPPPPMPTETDVVAYALALYNAQNPPPVAPPVLPPTESTPRPQSTPGAAEPLALPEITMEPLALVPSVAESQAPVTTEEAPAAMPMPNTTAPVVPPAAEPTFVSAGPADLDKAKTAIAEIFSAPTADPIAMTSSTPTPSVLPLIKSMLKKGMLPSWVRPDDAGIKE